VDDQAHNLNFSQTKSDNIFVRTEALRKVLVGIPIWTIGGLVLVSL